jgi:enamine deaminase RidA (YjgF/YER057c/UK114 family)
MNLQAVLEAAGSSPEKCRPHDGLYHEFEGLFQVQRDICDFFAEEFPARATIEVSALALDAEVEIQAIGLCSE